MEIIVKEIKKIFNDDCMKWVKFAFFAIQWTAQTLFCIKSIVELAPPSSGKKI